MTRWIALLLTVAMCGQVDAADTNCDTAELKVNAARLEPLGREDLQQRIALLEAQARRLRAMIEQQHLPPTELARIRQTLTTGIESAKTNAECLEQVENASLEARLELLRKFLDDSR